MNSPEHQPAAPEALRQETTHQPPASAILPLRIVPAIVLLIAMWTLKLGPAQLETVDPTLLMMSFFGPFVFALLILLWFVFFSRAALKEKVWGTLGVVLVGLVTTYLSHKSVRGFGTIMYTLPWAATAFAAALILFFRSSKRTGIAMLAALVAFGFWTLVRTDGMWGDFHAQRSWRWKPTSEELYLNSLATRSAVADGAAALDPMTEVQWPAFRGPQRNGIQPGLVLNDDWAAHPPKELWRVSVGPGWSSFSVAGDRLYTQEQRGDEEAVVCLDARTGNTLWTHTYPSRFWEVVGGAGPRATPTIEGDMLFTLGAEGILSRLNAVDGSEIWQRDLRQDADRQPPTWGFSSSPLVIGGQVIVHAGGAHDKGMLAYDLETGALAWSAPAGDHSYCSPQLMNIAGRAIVTILTNNGLTAVDPSDGTVICDYVWEFEGYRVVQPLLTGTNGLLIGTGIGTGTRRIDVTMSDGEFDAEEVWTTRDMKPDFNDYVAHQGYLYGFDHTIFACVDLSTGKRRWKKGRYGTGQVLLLPDGDQLLVMAETGDLVLLAATPEAHQELAKFQVLEGKTWNHPVLVGNRLFVRNGEEAACFEMTLAGKHE